MNPQVTTALDLTGLRTGPSQLWGAVRLVPLLRDQPVAGLRLHRRALGEEHGVVQVDPRTTYHSYLPHAFVADRTGDGTPVATYGTHLTDGGPAERPPTSVPLRFHHRLAKREGRARVRFLPQHLALEGYLSLHFGGPSVLWEEWSQRAVRQGLSPRAEEAWTGARVRGLGDALRLFEIHPGQCGLLLYLGDALAAAFAVPHPEDYRALHPTLVQDLYGEQVHHYATLMPPLPDFRARIAGTGIRSVADLRAAARGQEEEWAGFHDSTMAAGLLGPAYTFRTVRRLGPFTLSRFLPGFRRREENHIGETITDEAGRTAYLKTFRLSEKQVRRGHLLDRLAGHDWHLARTAADLGIDEAQLGLRLESAGFGALLRQDVLDGYRRQARAAEVR
ncbi:hypothetical protein GCM10010495_29970 [Kitasatospora herbaricolor]|uniref:ARPP-2 domain-containing protein n=1 Tax=Kitasatospora herbaricolor TaxID=68217 RepID=UPI001749EDDF|nr:hypothetical protein [Kitasatospora herbaricolor]MDQ0312181.1 hypothetical protein [Kitasatospora herbaricolor]GGV14127.1 hypothetical protein GCM10010495_29970 [Kitasatospora herbaricolor]